MILAAQPVFIRNWPAWHLFVVVSLILLGLLFVFLFLFRVMDLYEQRER
jgi:hypothetical protein